MGAGAASAPQQKQQQKQPKQQASWNQTVLLAGRKKNEAKQITEVDEDEDYDAFGEIRDF